MYTCFLAANSDDTFYCPMIPFFGVRCRALTSYFLLPPCSLRGWRGRTLGFPRSSSFAVAPGLMSQTSRGAMGGITQSRKTHRPASGDHLLTKQQASNTSNPRWFHRIAWKQLNTIASCLHKKLALEDHLATQCHTSINTSLCQYYLRQMARNLTISPPRSTRLADAPACSNRPDAAIGVALFIKYIYIFLNDGAP